MTNLTHSFYIQISRNVLTTAQTVFSNFNENTVPLKSTIISRNKGLTFITSDLIFMTSLPCVRRARNTHLAARAAFLLSKLTGTLNRSALFCILYVIINENEEKL